MPGRDFPKKKKTSSFAWEQNHFKKRTSEGAVMRRLEKGEVFSVEKRGLKEGEARQLAWGKKDTEQKGRSLRPTSGPAFWKEKPAGAKRVLAGAEEKSPCEGGQSDQFKKCNALSLTREKRPSGRKKKERFLGRQPGKKKKG